MVEQIKFRNNEYGLSRLIAGYSWEWVSKNNNNAFDIKIGNVNLKWNSTAIDWINTDSSINEVGCIHTTQGYDLNYAGIIFGNEITYNKISGKIEVIRENYFDKNGQNGINDIEDLKNFIINIYKTMMLRSIKGTYIYICDKNLREYFSRYIQLHTDKTTFIELLTNEDEVNDERTIPYYLEANLHHCVKNNLHSHRIKLPENFVFSEDLFAYTLNDHHMNNVIPYGTTCIFKKYVTGNLNGKIALVKVNGNNNSDYRIRELRINKFSEEQSSINLLCLSDEAKLDSQSSKDVYESNSIEIIATFERVLGYIKT